MACLFLAERLKELADVRRRAYVDEEQLGQLVVGQLAFGQHPAAEDEQQQQNLLKDSNPLVVDLEQLSKCRTKRGWLLFYENGAFIRTQSVERNNAINRKFKIASKSYHFFWPSRVREVLVNIKSGTTTISQDGVLGC